MSWGGPGRGRPFFRIVGRLQAVDDQSDYECGPDDQSYGGYGRDHGNDDEKPHYTSLLVDRIIIVGLRSAGPLLFEHLIPTVDVLLRAFPEVFEMHVLEIVEQSIEG